jgi:hypothetical protein
MKMDNVRQDVLMDITETLLQELVTHAKILVQLVPIQINV